jgi:uncharacterized membrane protein
VAGYVALALLLGIEGPDLGGTFIPSSSSPLSPASAVAMLSSIAAGMLTLTGVVFSFVFVALQFGTTAYSPRLVKEFGGGQTLSHALGIFTGTALYALAAIRTVDIEGRPGVNTAVVAVAGLWLVASVVALVLLVPRLAGLSISNVLENLEAQGDAAIRACYPDRLGPANEPSRATEGPPGEVTQEIRHRGPPRYLLAVDARRLVSLAREAGGMLRVPYAVGDRVIPGELVARVLGARQAVSEHAVRRALPLGASRSLYRDPAYALRLLVDIAIRALSPAINDPTTAVTTLDKIEALLRRLGVARLDVGAVTDAEGNLRLQYDVPCWEDYVSLALTEIGQYGRESVQVQRRLVAMLHDLMGALPQARHAALQAQVPERQAGRGDGAPGGAHVPLTADPQGLGHALGHVHRPGHQ